MQRLLVIDVEKACLELAVIRQQLEHSWLKPRHRIALNNRKKKLIRLVALHQPDRLRIKTT